MDDIAPEYDVVVLGTGILIPALLCVVSLTLAPRSHGMRTIRVKARACASFHGCTLIVAEY